ncbi:MAG: hypothetical protein ACRES3_07585 [Steroidobacteraceae bacterium]
MKPGLDRGQARKEPGILTPRWFETRCLRPVVAVPIAMLLWSGATAQEGEAESTSANESAAVEWIRALPVPVEPAFPLTDVSELCRDKPQGPVWIDRMQGALYRSMCFTAVRFDSFFGSARFDDEYQATHGSLSVGALWDERDHWDPSVRFRVQMQLPRMSDRLSAFVGKVDPDEYVTEQRDDFDTLPRQFGRETDDEVLFGLGYSQPGRRGGRFDVSGGTSFDSPKEAYAKGTYRIALPLLARNLLRLRETIFWEDRERLGATTRFDLERLFTDDLLVRWTGSATFAQETEGVRWFSHVTLYQNLRDGRAISYQVGVAAESDLEVPVTDYGLRLIYRRTIFDRDWLFLELRSSLTWPRESLLERRESVWGAGAALEMMFGERRKR